MPGTLGDAMEQVLKRIADARSLPILWRDMARFLGQQGFRAVGYYLMRQGSSQVATSPIQVGYSRKEVDAYLASDFRRLDIVHRVVLAHGLPMRWSTIWRNTETSAEERGFQSAMIEAGFREGLAIPLYGPNMRNATVNLSHMSDTVDLGHEAVALVHFVAQAAHLRICAMFAEEASADRHLSTREKEILDWVARGKSNGVIADILEISPGTVDTYMRRIYEKLEVSDRTSAAVKGVGMGLIAA